MAANRIYIQVDFQSENANAAISELNKNIGSIGPATESASKVANTGVKSMTVAITQASQEFLNFGNVIAGLAIVKLAAGFATVADELNRIEIGLTALNGNAQQTISLMNSVRQIARTSPFNVAELAAAAQQMEAFKFKAAEIPSTLKTISNAMAALNKDAGTMEGLIRVLGTAMGRDKLPAMTLYRNVNALGIDVTTAMQKMLKEQGYGVFSPQGIQTLLKGSSEIGKLSGRAMVEGILDSLKEVPDVSEQMGKLVTVNWKNVVDDFNRLVQKIESDFAPALDGILKTSSKILDVFRTMPDWLTKSIEGLGTFALVLGGILTTVKAIRSISMVVGGISALARGAGAAGGVATGVAEGAAAGAVGLGFTLEAAAALSAAALGAALGKLTADKLGKSAGFLDWMNKNVAERFGLTKMIQTWAAPEGFDEAQAGAVDMYAKLQRGFAGLSIPSDYAKKKVKDPLIEANEEKIKAQIEAAEKDLASAREKEIGGIKAVQIKYAELYKENAGNTKALAIYRQAELLREAKVIEDYRDKTAEEQIKNERARLDAVASYSDKMARRRSEIEAARSTSTLEQAARVTAAVTVIEDAGALQRASYEKQLADEVYEKDKLARAKDKKEGIPFFEVEARRKVDSAKRDIAYSAADQKADEEIARRQADVFKKVAQETTEYQTSLRQESRQDELSGIATAAQLAKDKVKTGEDQNAAARVESIRQIAVIEIDAAQKVADKKKQFNQEDFDDQMKANEVQLAFAKARYSPEVYQELADRVNDLQVAAAKDLAKKREMIVSDEADNEAKIRMEANTKANEKIIEEQKEVYDKLKSAAGTVWDALFSRSGKSVGQAIGDAIKGAFVNMAKNIVTSNISASLMEVVTGEKVTMESRGSFGTGPLGKLAGMLTQHPVFHPDQTKLNLPAAVSSTTTGQTGTPVVIQNPPGHALGAGPRSIEIDQNTIVTHRFEGSVSGDGGTIAATRVAAAVARTSPMFFATSQLVGSAREVGRTNPVLAAVLGMSLLGNAAAAVPAGGGGGGGYYATGAVDYGGGVVENAGRLGGGGGAIYARGPGGGIAMISETPPEVQAMEMPSGFGGYGGGFGGGIPGAAPAGAASASTSSIWKALATAGSSADTWKTLKSLGIGTGTPGSVLQGGWGAAGTRLATGNLANMAGMTLIGMGLQRNVHGLAATTDLVGGGALVGAHYASALGMEPAGGAILGASAGLFAAGVKRGGGLGTLMDVVGGAGAGAALGTRFLGPGLGTAIGAAVGATVGLGVGLLRQTGVIQTIGEKVKARVKQFYGINLTNQNIIDQIADIATKNYHGDVTLAVTSPEVMQLMQLYAVSTGQNPGGMPRPMYSATLAQSQAGGLQLQPVYNNGQVVASPYAGVTTQQYSQAADYLQRGIHLQLDPQMANDLFEGRVVSVMGNNPQAVAQANTAAVSAGDSRNAQLGALMEPLTVTT